MSFKYLVAIPVFNEEASVAAVLQRTRAYAEHILVIDDGSTDSTPDLLAGFKGISLIQHPQNQGYGQSLIDAFNYAAEHDFDWLITMDCDEQHEPAAIPQFVAAMRRGSADVISGSRYLRGRSDDDLPPADRRSINLKITALLNQRLGLALTDAFCGFKAYRVGALRRLTLTERGYAFPLEFWPQAVRRGLTIEELPVRLVYKDPNRQFGGGLDNPTVRYRHYLEVFEATMRALDASEADAGQATPAARTKSGCC